MTRVLDHIRRLDEALSAGRITDAEYAKRRERLLGLVEEAEVSQPAAVPNDTAKGATLLRQGFLLISGLSVLTAVVAWAADDIWLALTLSLTLLAGAVIHMARGLFDEDAAERRAQAQRAEARRAKAQARAQAAKEAAATDAYDPKTGKAVPAE